MQVGQGWTWLRGETSTRPHDKTQHAATYSLELSFEGAAKFDDKSFLASAFDGICLSEDPRAERCALELMEDAGIPTENSTVTRTSTGFVMESYQESRLRLAKMLFADCSKVSSKNGIGVDCSWKLTVDWPDTLPENRSGLSPRVIQS
jgi:hypothetical protein